VIVVDEVQGGGAALASVRLPRGWVRREGFALPVRPWDLSDRRWMCVGVIETEGDAEGALTALARGVGLVVSVRGAGGFRLRVLDDLHHSGRVLASSEEASRPVLAPEDVVLLRSLADGATVEGAARGAGMSVRTAHRRLAAVRSAYGATNTTEAVARWLRSGGADDG
jgi:hypothetical protein